MGAAAFLIAEFLHISYLEVIVMAAIPAALYYLSIFLMVEADSRRLGLRPIDADLPAWATLTRRGWYHFASIASIVVLMAQGFTTFRSVLWAMVLAVACSFLNRETALTPRRLAAALSSGGRGVLPVAATTAAAGIIVGVVTLTGLGLKVAGLIVALAGASLPLTIVYSGIAVWMLGLAVPVTASYIIAAVMVVPALVQVGVAEIAAHMFVFYYAVLSEVSPPTALSPFAAAAITGGNPFRTTMLSWRYTAPAFIVPVAFTIDPRGLGLLLHSTPADTLRATASAVLALIALAAAAGGWMRSALSPVERVLAARGSGAALHSARCPGRDRRRPARHSRWPPVATMRLFQLPPSEIACAMARYTLVYGIRLVPEGTLVDATEARLTLSGGESAGLTLHTIDGTIPQLRRSLDRSLDAFFDFLPGATEDDKRQFDDSSSVAARTLLLPDQTGTLRSVRPRCPPLSAASASSRVPALVGSGRPDRARVRRRTVPSSRALPR